MLDFIFKFKTDRNTFKSALLKKLNIDNKTISDEEFAQFYKNNLASKFSLVQIPDTKEYNIGKNLFSGKELKEAINLFQESLINKNKEKNNEIIGYLPKISAMIAKEEESLDALPDEFLDFAYENDYPIILIP